MGGLVIYSESDVINYAFLASHLRNDSLQAKILGNSDLSSMGPTFDWALAYSHDLCGSNAFFLHDKTAGPYDEKDGRGLF